MLRKKVLVIMATYNGEKFLRRQLDSLYDQKGVSVSVLVRDDGSTDKTIKILQEYNEMQDLIWYQGQHVNVSKGFYELMKKAFTMPYDYIAFCDQDDVWDEDKLLTGVNAIKDEKIPALYYCGQRLVDAEENFIAEHELNRERNLLTRFILSDFAGCTGVFNKYLLEEVISFEPEYMLMHDTWILKVCLCVGGKVVVDPSSHMNYRQHGGNTVGLGRSLPAYLKQVRQYLFEYKVEESMNQLFKGYQDKMVSPYKEFCCYVMGYKVNKTYRRQLLHKKNIDFCNRGLNFTYWLKVILRKL